ncbi:hypothetical protein [Actinopolymorpha cephalotaxi]|uniref:DUF3153 domain-containing protein n=1 Tax=Actinopolymorpha cephalotaxi TaxID=504797 RepID=A0ABX2S519_9ACTN|nr:hypothetical protein [Actinopolymorpha cephalotaxi]NYH83326.1 hypothetical protein [Actinopolymorpha cephalotaxi]
MTGVRSRGRVRRAVPAGLALFAGFALALTGLLAASGELGRRPGSPGGQQGTRLAVPSTALVTGQHELGGPARLLDRLTSRRSGAARITAVRVDGGPVFIGITRSADRARYLRGTGVAHVDLRASPADVSYAPVAAGRRVDLPTREGIWAAWSVGPGARTLTWPLRPGGWELVVMNADADPGVDVRMSVGTPSWPRWPVLAAFLAGGALLAAVGLTVLHRSPPGSRPTGVTPTSSPAASADQEGDA